MKFEEIRSPNDIAAYLFENAVDDTVAGMVNDMVAQAMYEGHIFFASNQSMRRNFSLGNVTKFRAHDKTEIISGPCFRFSVAPIWNMLVIMKMFEGKIVEAMMTPNTCYVRENFSPMQLLCTQNCDF